MTSRRLIFCLLALIALSASSIAQVATGTPPFGTFTGGPDVINLANLNVQLTIPVVSKPGRGIPFTHNIIFNNSIWYPVTVSGSTSWQHTGNWGWNGDTEGTVGYVSYANTGTIQCGFQGQTVGTVYANYQYHDPHGAAHSFPVVQYTACGTNQNTGSANDGSGYYIDLTAGTVTAKDGKVITPQFSQANGNVIAQDTNGNQITATATTFTDTLGNNVLAVSGTAPSNVSLTYTDSTGTSESYVIHYSTYTVKTNFGCTSPSAVTDFPATSESLISSIDLPDGTSYSFTYEDTPSFAGDVTGRLKQITLPTGGHIGYSYDSSNHNGINCADGSTLGTFTRTLPHADLDTASDSV